MKSAKNIVALGLLACMYVLGPDVQSAGAANVYVINNSDYHILVYVYFFSSNTGIYVPHDDPLEFAPQETRNWDPSNYWFNSLGKLEVYKKNKDTSMTLLGRAETPGCYTLIDTECYHVRIEISKNKETTFHWR